LLENLGVQYDAVKVNLRDHTYGGGNYYEVNPKGSVPAIELDNGEVITENAVILQYLADLRPDSGMLPRIGSLDRYRAQEWLNFIATELHKGFSPLFHKETPEDYKPILREKLAKSFAFIAKPLAERPFLLGDRLGAPDTYLYVILRWSTKMKIDFEGQPSLVRFYDRMNQLPVTKRTLEAEGLT
jgi:glutathione S-transferase